MSLNFLLLKESIRMWGQIIVDRLGLHWPWVLQFEHIPTLQGSSSLKDLNREADEPVDLLKLNALKGIGSPGGSLKARLYRG